MAKDDGQERTEQPTPKKLEEARKKGQVPRSRELNTLVMMLASSGGLLLLGDQIVLGLSELMQSGLQIERTHAFDTRAMGLLLGGAIRDAIGLIIPFCLLLLIAALLGPMALGGGSVSLQAMAPKFSKLNPIKGLGRIFSLKGLTELLKALLKFVLIGSVGALLLWKKRDAFLGLGDEPLYQAIAHAGHLLGWAFLALSAALLLIAAVDVPFQLWDHSRQLRMTRQEVKDEMKDTEGRPEVKGRIRQLQREMAQRRMMHAVPEADVVVTNPTHYAVALRYDPETMRAPKVVAKGGDLIAARIRALAQDADVPLLSSPALARALFFSTELEQEVPAALYLAVAQVLAYIFQLRAARREGGEVPTPPSELPVPDEFFKDR